MTATTLGQHGTANHSFRVPVGSGDWIRLLERYLV